MLKKVILTNVFPTGLTVFCVKRFKTVTAEWSPILHDVSLSTQDRFTLEAAEVLHVPVATLSFRAFISKNDLFGDKKKNNFYLKWPKRHLGTQSKQHILFVQLTH